MSPLSLRRYRAERLLRDDFERRRARVTAIVRGRLAARGVTLAPADVESCYAQAWQGLYAATLAGTEIDNHTGWLVLVTYRRALDEHRAGERHGRLGADADAAGERTAASQPDTSDLAAQLDGRVRLRAWLGGVRRFDGREREAAAL